jgi:hypothetical protein
VLHLSGGGKAHPGVQFRFTPMFLPKRTTPIAALRAIQFASGLFKSSSRRR